MMFHEELSDLATLTVPNSHRPTMRHVQLEKKRSEQKALNGGFKQECLGISPETVLNRREREKLRKRRRNVVAKDPQGPSEMCYRTRSISRVKEEEEEVQELGNANISGISKPKKNTDKSRSRDLPVKCEEDNEMIAPRSFSYTKSRRP
ncbi:hypothetical protein PanWU01x14_141980 [Parasponia andersonii]|uniref:Uncharacterized protein n=1 Tax=Parasponia andersonii TaxID=3476 RepID=A0A2P5CLV6_PARAD|nr:hypothetical protein PanWU01x14_141980 [Parasponia andersonii]